MYQQEKVLPFGGNENKGKQVSRMFDSIAKTYDKINHFMSLGIDRYWRNKLIRSIHPFAQKLTEIPINRQQKGADILDIATGTGDLAILEAKRLNPKSVIGVDISEGMMAVGREKVAKEKLDKVISFSKEDATKMTFADESFDIITTSFGIRNFENLDAALLEIRRVLRPNGVFAILELSEPIVFPMKQLFRIYSHTFLPLIGRMIANDKNSYDYLVHSIEAFPQGEMMTEIVKKAGFSKVSFKRLTFGICTLYLIEK
ncbi:MAG: bifunctional demethylmenaquinone methyltransferase/2-methoxy-6-polyprenyl-1,4-benzoquinol methylase UbiE [Bacteroidaceae bacterium]|nr:bifunctional demethylmenaquinone methyltransferase/2-methoxy-6-polyprenyl-1,4-benzoquinol methylase UbiE [Bacteroidaceae bacterium]